MTSNRMTLRSTKYVLTVDHGVIWSPDLDFHGKSQVRRRNEFRGRDPRYIRRLQAKTKYFDLYEETSGAQIRE